MYEVFEEERDLEAGREPVAIAAKRIPTSQLWERNPDREQRKVEIKQSPFFLEHGRTELEVFQTLVGVHFLEYGGGDLKDKARQDKPASVMSDIFRPARAAGYRHRNRGLYDRCISEDMKMRVMYSFSHYVISGLYLLQVLVAATLTAISASNDISFIPVTVLGAINTVIAGVLAWLNGQGMPNRYRRARDQYCEVVKAIEASERMFAEIDFIEWPAGTPRPTPISERNRLEELYNLAKEDKEGNYPNSEKNPGSTSVLEKAQKLAAMANSSGVGGGSSVSSEELEELKILRDEKSLMKRELEELKDYRNQGMRNNASSEELQELKTLREDKASLMKRLEEMEERFIARDYESLKTFEKLVTEARQQWEQERPEKDGEAAKSS